MSSPDHGYRARLSANVWRANNPEKTEAWLAEMGFRLRPVWFLQKSGWTLARQVDDPETFDEAVDVVRQRMGARYVLYPFGDKWVLVGGSCGYAKDYPSREAAEMVAIHGA